MQEEKNKKNEDEIVKYRLDKLEESVGRLLILSDSIIKLEARFQNIDMNLHSRHTDFEKKITKIDEDVSVLKSFMYKAIGVLAVINIALQLLGPIVTKTITESSSPKIEIVEKM